MPDVVVLDAKLDLSAAAALRDQLLSHMDADLVLDAQKVTHMGALCTQILIAGARKAGSGGHAVNMINTSDRVLGQMAAMGLSPEFITRGPR